jgi:NAD(P)-dependent dehydrogenase (short-subunit alcohol dehydrogenase family)
VLASNAGLSHLQPLQDITAAQFDQMPAVNLAAPFLLAQCAAGSMREPGSGRILLISRAAAFTGGIAGPHHAASKAGLHALTHFPASRLAATGATVNALTPAPAAGTRMLPGDPAQPRGRCPPAGPASHPRPPTPPRPSSPRPTRPTRSSPSTAAATPDRHRTAFTTARGRPGRAPADIGSAVIHDRYHHQDDDRYAAEADIHPRSDDA